MSYSNQVLGQWGEDAAARYLEGTGWVILARNFRSGHKEIDLVARRGEVLAFVEVKTRSGKNFGHPFEAITARKQAEIESAACHWIQEHGEEGLTYRFDALAILPGRGGRPSIEHLEDAWRPKG